MHEDPAESAAARWRANLAEHRRSGQSVRDYCAARGLKTPTFYQWRRRLAAPERPAFLPIRVAYPRSVALEPSGVEVVLTSGHRIGLGRGFDQDVLRAAVAALAGPQPC